MTTNTLPPGSAVNPDQAAGCALATAIEFATEYGRIKLIAEALSEATGQTVSRQMVGRWLNPDPSKRMQTNLGMGLMLLLVIAKMTAESRAQINDAQAGKLTIWIKKP